MVQHKMGLHVVDNSGAILAYVIRPILDSLTFGFTNRFALAVVSKADPRKAPKRGSVYQAHLTGLKRPRCRRSGFTVKCHRNEAVLLKKDGSPLANRINRAAYGEARFDRLRQQSGSAGRY